MAQFQKGHTKQGGNGKGSSHRITVDVKLAAIELLQVFIDTGMIADDILQLTPSERINAIIRILSIITPRDTTHHIAESESHTTIEQRLAQLARENDN